MDKVDQIKLLKSTWIDQIFQFYQLDQPSAGLVKYFTICPDGGGGMGVLDETKANSAQLSWSWGWAWQNWILKKLTIFKVMYQISLYISQNAHRAMKEQDFVKNWVQGVPKNSKRVLGIFEKLQIFNFFKKWWNSFSNISASKYPSEAVLYSKWMGE